MNHLIHDPWPNSAVVKSVYSVSGSLLGQRRAEHADEDQRRQDVDQHAVDALGGHRDLRVARPVAALAHVAGGRLHRDHAPGDREHPGEDERGVRVGSLGGVEPGDVGPVEAAWLEQRKQDQDGKRHHARDAEEGGEARAKPHAEVAGDVDRQQPGEADQQHGRRDRRAEAAEQVDRAALRDVEQRRQVGGGEDHVDRRDREPAQPVRPAGQAAEVFRRCLPDKRLKGGGGVGRDAAGPVRPQVRQLRQAQAQHEAEDRVDADRPDRGGAHALNGVGRDPGHQDRPGQADDERAPPVGALLQPLLPLRYHSHSTPSLSMDPADIPGVTPRCCGHPAGLAVCNVTGPSRK